MAAAYGRIIKDDSGQVLKIVEARDATPEELAVGEYNTGILCFRTELMIEALANLTTDNDQGEYYLTDTVAWLVGKGHRVEAVATEDPDEVGRHQYRGRAGRCRVGFQQEVAMTMDRLCTPWRFDYVTGKEKEEGCVFCNRLDCDEAENYVLHRGHFWYLILNLYPYNSGHLLLVLNRHQPLLSGCTPEELVEMSSLLGVMEGALMETYRPDGINCGYNGGASAGAGIPEHMHVHMFAALGRGYEFHEHHRPDPGDAPDPGSEL